MNSSKSSNAVSKNPMKSEEVRIGVGALLKHHQSVQEKSGTSLLMEDRTALSLMFSLRNIPPSRVRPFVM
jgi:hypothetical protein